MQIDLYIRIVLSTIALAIVETPTAPTSSTVQNRKALPCDLHYNIMKAVS